MEHVADNRTTIILGSAIGVLAIGLLITIGALLALQTKVTELNKTVLGTAGTETNRSGNISTPLSTAPKFRSQTK